MLAQKFDRIRVHRGRGSGQSLFIGRPFNSMASQTPTAPKAVSEQIPLLQNQHRRSSLESRDPVSDAPVGVERPLSQRFTKGEIIRYSLFGLFAVTVTATIVYAIIRTPDVKVFPSVPREFSDH
jgi:hypothetical protein